MNRSDVTTRAAAGADAARRIIVAGAWLRIPSAAPGVLRVRPLPGEATASYTQSLADAYRLTLPQLLDGVGITLHRHGTPPAAELHLNHSAAQHLAVLARTPLPHLARALPHLALLGDAHGTGAAARWKRLLDHLADPLALPDLARHARMSVRTFTRRFRDETGISPAQWILQQRITRARHLLEGTNLPIDQVAIDAGLGSGTTLRQHMRATLGVSPGVYRKTFRYEEDEFGERRAN
ncbi:helix-turn-helix domain-containing protein [Streptomyces sp. CA2R101]|uniref:helix-turn-helix domain-containing protein n=1 Tax=Streptomyces sp. CA2R101 TaxID=3120152 RepID=UPI003FA6D902